MQHELTAQRLDAMATQWDRCARNAAEPSYIRTSPADEYQRYARLCRAKATLLRQPGVYDEHLDDWFTADCQHRQAQADPICGQPAVVHRPDRLIVRHLCVDHADPDELERAAARRTNTHR